VCLGEDVVAWVKLRPGAAVVEEELAAFCRGKIAMLKIPRYRESVERPPDDGGQEPEGS